MLNVESIGNNAFAMCRTLDRLYIPETDRIDFEVGATFEHPDGLSNGSTSPFDESPIVGDNGRSVKVFADSTIQSVVLPSDLDVITYKMFANCATLSEIKFFGREYDGKNELNGVTEIGDMAFASCAKLENIYIPSTVETMGSKVFYDFGSNNQLNKQNIFRVICLLARKHLYCNAQPAGKADHGNARSAFARGWQRV